MMCLCIFIYTVICFIFGIFIFGGRGYTNAQPAKFYFGFLLLLAAGTFWEWPVCEMQGFDYQNSILQIQNSAAAAAEV